ncbi:P22 phage major capsid protein family protein [Paenarthrobacter sp. NPDC089714]|uniref:P22 phage major capsid protein family protein n=1 Tax=Paenarthrobacter sp. NPDC089714 TaxID=3364377 RepID=UPI003813082C
MTNSFLTAENIARTAANLVGQDLGLAGKVYRDLEADFAAGKGNKVKVRVPGAVAAQTRSVYDTSTPLVSDEIAEQSIDVELTDHVYDNVVLSEGDLDLEVVDFSKQVLIPQATAIVKYVEKAVATAMKATPETAAIAYSAAAPAKTFTQIRKALRDNGVPTEAPLVAAVGSGVYADLLDGPAGTWDESGKVRGFEIIESTRLASDEIVGFVKEAFALVVRAPQVPQGAPFGASVTDGGFSLRYIRSYDGTVAADRSLVSAFVGVQAMPLAVDNENGTISLVDNGGAVRVLTAA